LAGACTKRRAAVVILACLSAAVEAVQAQRRQIATEAGSTALNCVYRDGDLAQVKKLLADGANVNASASNGATAVMCIRQTKPWMMVTRSFSPSSKPTASSLPVAEY